MGSASATACMLTMRSFGFRAATPQLQENEDPVAHKPPRPARQALKLSKKRRPAKLDVTSSMYHPQSVLSLHCLCTAEHEILCICDV